jgi:hypothetical protein
VLQIRLLVEEVMPNFTVKDISPARFGGEFAIETDPAHIPSGSEAAYLSKLKEILTMLADDERQDSTKPLQPLLAGARRQYRTTEAAKLHLIAQEFADGKIDADAAVIATTEVTQKYAQNCPNLVAQEKAAGEARFAGDFTATAPNYQPDDAEKAYISRLAFILEMLAREEDADKKTRYTVARLAKRQECRKDAASRLRKGFEEFCKGDIIAANAAENAWLTAGIYVANRDRLAQPLFDVSLEKDEKDDAKRAVGVHIDLTSGLPPPDDQPSPEKQDLFVQLGNASTVIRTVSQHIDERAEKIAKRWWYGRKERRERRANVEHESAKRLADEYFTKLAGVAEIGLQGPHTNLAKLGLDQLRAEFTAQQAGRIKNIYVRSLGAAAVAAAAPLLLLYAFIIQYVRIGWWYDHKAFLIAAAGAAIGTWLSFSVRRVNLSFSDLGILEEDLLDPSVRIIFVIALTLTACLLFWTGVMNIQIGDLKTDATGFMGRGSVAMLVGVLFGISERALATAISGRATAFVRSIGSS